MIYRTAKYIRTSCSDDKTECSNSVVNQRKLIDKFIESQPEIIAISERIDDGYSGLSDNRPAFSELFADIEDGVIDCLIVKDLSRLTRDYIEAGRYLRDYFPAHGVRFISIDDNIDSVQSDGFDKTIALLKSIFNEQYSRDVSIKTRGSLMIKRKQGQYIGAIPIYGYQKSADDKHKLIPDPNTADVVQSIFRMKLDGMSAVAISRALNDLKILSPLSYKRKIGVSHPSGGFADRSNAAWSATTVLRILRDENYTGTLVQGRQKYLSYKSKILVDIDANEWVKMANTHQAIISRDDYEAVQRTLATDTRTSPKYDRVHIFSGLLICGYCGGNMTRKTVPHKDKHYVYYYCPTGNRKGCNSSHSISENQLVSIVANKIGERIDEIRRLDSYIHEARFKEFIWKEQTSEVFELEVKLQDLHKYRIHLQDCRGEYLINYAEFHSLSVFYNSEIARLESELIALRQESFRTINPTTEWVQSFMGFSNMKDLDRFTIVKMICDIRILATKEVVISFVHQSEYEQLIRYIAFGGHDNGEKKPKTE